MVVCNSCRYCEGLCAAFPAMEMRRIFRDGYLNYLANLCHNCGACYVDCQFLPPHKFEVNVPRALARVRTNPNQGLCLAAGFVRPVRQKRAGDRPDRRRERGAVRSSFVALRDPAVLFGTHDGPGAFYKLMPHNAMVALFGAVFVYAILAIVRSACGFWRDIAGKNPLTDAASIVQTVKDAGRPCYLDGGSGGCVNEGERPTGRRKHYHHATFYGFLLCFASTSVATLYHFLLGRKATYPWYDRP